MDSRSLEKLRFDRRLIRRNGWLSQKDLARELEALPDVSEKIAPDEDSDGESGASAESPASE